MRLAIYFAPDPQTRLWQQASAWLGRDAAQDRRLPCPCTERLMGLDVDALTAAPRRYGFHATLKAPFHLARGVAVEQIAAALATFCARRPPTRIALRVDLLDDFVALVADEACPDIDALASAVVVGFERFGAPCSEGELVRRRTAGLSARQEDLLHAWGYPFVLDQFRFHMSLTGRVDALRARSVRDGLALRFAETLRAPVAVDRLALFVEPEVGAPFHVHSFFRLAGEELGSARPQTHARS